MTITWILTASGWNTPTERFYVNTATKLAYADSAFTQEITDIQIPTKECYKFVRYHSKYKSGTDYTTYVDSDGRITDNCKNYSPGYSVTNYPTIEGEIYSYKISCSNDGVGGTEAFYKIKTATGAYSFYADDQCWIPITYITPPTKDGYYFDGYYNNSSYSTKVIDSDGILLDALSSQVTANKTIYAKFVNPDYNITFNSCNGTGQTATQPMRFDVANKLITPSFTKSMCYIAGWATSDGGEIVYKPNETVINLTSTSGATVQLYAVWKRNFGVVVDYFNLASDALIPEASDSGDNRKHTCAYNATNEETTTKTSGIWRNPTVVYRVVEDTNLSVTLGKAELGNGQLQSGYMISQVEVETQLAEAPKVKVIGVANEGADAIKTYQISIPISKRHRPQNLLNALSGGGTLQSLKLTAAADAVVLAENGIPCASDLCRGKMIVDATLAAYDGEPSPDAANGFVKISESKNNSGISYELWNVNVRKELI